MKTLKPSTINNVKAFVTNTHGKIFTVFFEKKNGEVRKMNCRTGVKKYLKEKDELTKSVTKDSNKNHIIVFDMKAHGYRTVNLEKVSEIRFNDTILIA